MRSLKLHGLLDHGERTLRRFPSALDAMIGIKDAHNSRNARLRSPTARVTRQRNAPRRRPMIRTVTRHNLVTPGEETGDFDGIFVRLSATVREEECIDVARRNFCQFCAQPSARL